MIIVDANVITHMILKGDFSKDCGELFIMDSDWAAPRLWRDEVSNVLVTYERGGLISRKESLLAFSDAEAVMGANDFDVKIERVLTVAHQTGCSGYDSQYIALAEDLGLKLYTYDRKVLSSVPAIACKPKS